MNTTLRQALRFSIVGVLSNSVGFGWYLLLTWFGMGPKTAMSALFLIGTCQTFFFNKRWSFEYKDDGRRLVWRYLATYGLGYLLNLLALVVLVEHAHFPHYLVQGMMIIVVALFTFSLQKFWVFQRHSKPPFQAEKTS